MCLNKKYNCNRPTDKTEDGQAKTYITLKANAANSLDVYYGDMQYITKQLKNSCYYLRKYKMPKMPSVINK